MSNARELKRIKRMLDLDPKRKLQKKIDIAFNLLAKNPDCLTEEHRKIFFAVLTREGNGR